MTRPPDTSSSVSAIFASSAGLRYGAALTYVPSRTRDVTAASAVSSVHDSQAPVQPPSVSGSPKPTWSETQTASKPIASASSAIARRSAQRGVAPSIDPST